MIFHGFQKMTMLDFPGYVAATLFTAGCNFRCQFCHNALLVTKIDNDITFSEEEILKYLNKRKGIVDGICITGGEPLMHSDLAEFIAKVKELGFLVKLDTNGTFPGKLKNLIDKKLVDYVAMDIKNSPEKYSLTAGADIDMDSIYNSIGILLENKVPFEFRTTVVKELHSDDDFEKIGKLIEGAPKYFLQQYVDSENNIFQGYTPCNREETETFQSIVRKYVKSAEIRGV